MTDRRSFVAGITAILATPRAGETQPGSKTYRVGMLYVTSVPPDNPVRAAFVQGLREFGFVQGENLQIERLGADGDLSRFPAMAAELVRRQVDVIVAINTNAVKAAKQATRTTPIVMVLATDPEGDGLIASFRHPGGNVTGVAHLSFDIASKTLQFLRELLPNARRVAFVINRSETARRMATNLQKAAAPIGLTLDAVAVTDGGADFEGVLGPIATTRPDAIWFWAFVTFPDDRRLVEFPARHRLPAVHFSRAAVEAGGLMSYAENNLVTWRRVARYVGKLLQGARPQDLPVEQPSQVELVINLKTARTLGLTVPPSLLLRADQVIDQ